METNLPSPISKLTPKTATNIQSTSANSSNHSVLSFDQFLKNFDNLFMNLIPKNSQKKSYSALDKN